MTAPGGAVPWLLWFLAVAAVPVVSRNPLYLGLDLLVVLVVYLSIPRRSGTARAWRLFVAIGSTLALLSIGFNLLTVHVGDRTLGRLPDALPIVGGRLTWNALVYGCISALAIATLLIAAAAFNTAVRQGDLIRLLPSSFTSLGIATSIGITMVPQTIASARDIYDAQRARGHRFRSLRDARGFLVPLLGTGMERGLALSEALEARGFGASVADVAPPQRRHTAMQAIAVLALLGSLALIGVGQILPGLLAIVLGVALMLVAAPQRSRRTRYRAIVWDTPALVIAGCSLLSLVVTISRAVLTSGLTYYPFPRLAMPPFDPLTGAEILLLLGPIWWTSR
jgi:energy-coupling factor transport system permease protein